jgi:hypothetical protein
MLILKFPCRVPQDIPSASPTKNNAPGSESPKVENPPSPSTKKSSLAMSKPPGLEDIKASTSASRNLTSPSITNSRRDAAHQSLGPSPTERQEASPQDPKSFRLGACGGLQVGGSSSKPRLEKQPRQYSRVVESLSDNPDFISAGYHIGRYVTVSMNTEAEREQIKALYFSMMTTSKLIDVSIYASPL